jgi:hypothetical protein
MSSSSNIQAQLLQDDGNEFLQQTITQQKTRIESLKSNFNHLNKVIIDNANEWFQNSTKSLIN